MMLIKGPVGLRFKKQNVRNLSSDQASIIDLLARIPDADGGKRDSWLISILNGPDGSCPSALSDAIWDFQTVWKNKRVFNIVDGVCDPDGRSIRQMLFLAQGPKPVDPDPLPPQRRQIVSQPRIAGTWQITNIWSVALGEVGQLGGIQLDIAQPDGKKFRVTGAGAGFGLSVDPVSWAKALKSGARALNPLVDAAEVTLKAIGVMIGKGVVFSVGDYLQKLGVSLSSVTGGRLVANPINRFVGRPDTVSRQMIAGGVKSPFMIISLGAGIGAGAEGGLVAMGGGGLGLTASALGIYGTAGVTLKVGAGVQGLLYHTVSVEDVT